jgi:hypothetical protein
MRCVVVIPVGPGHEVYAPQAVASAWKAWKTGRGPFTELGVVIIDDTRGEMGRSAARNRGMDENPADWHFLLDADDRMMPGAFALVDLTAPATFGAICLDGKILDVNRIQVDHETIVAQGARGGTLSMGFFVRGDLGLRFDEALDAGEDFDLYLRLPGFTKRDKPLVSIGYELPSAGGPRGYDTLDWLEACDRAVERYVDRIRGAFAKDGLRRVHGVGNYLDPDDPGEPGYPDHWKRRSVTDEEAEILAKIATGKRVMEIGTGLGVSTRAIASTAAHVVTVDPDPWVKDPCLANVEFRRSLPSADVQFDLAFIDGHHREDAVVADILSCRKIPMLVIHDSRTPSVRAAIERCGLVSDEEYHTGCIMERFHFPPSDCP